MPQMSPMLWLLLFLYFILLMIFMMIQINFFFMEKNIKKEGIELNKLSYKFLW